jgi:hypothetical protein
MPSASYYRRKAELLLSVAKKTENPQVSSRCSFLAEEYQSIALMLGDDETEAAPALEPTIDHPESPTSRSRTYARRNEKATRSAPKDHSPMVDASKG